MTSNAPDDFSATNDKSSELTALVGCGVVVLSVLILTLVVSFIHTMFRVPVFRTLYQAEGLTTFFANLVVVLYAFPAFVRTKDRGLLCIALAALVFAYSALFMMLLGIRPPATAWHFSREEARWYYATRYITGIVGLVLYSYGVVSLIRRTGRKA